MRIERHSSVKTADRVLRLVKKLGDPNARPVELKHYSNGREQGYTLTTWMPRGSRAVAFAECRSSSDVVVYTGSLVEFLGAGNAPSEDAYRRARRFDREDLAAEYIVAFLEGRAR